MITISLTWYSAGDWSIFTSPAATLPVNSKAQTILVFSSRAVEQKPPAEN